MDEEEVRYVLALYEAGNLPDSAKKSSNVRDQINCLLFDAFTPYNTGKREEHEKFVVECYNRSIQCDKTKSFSVYEIYEEVLCYNWNIFLQIGEIDFYDKFYDDFILENPNDYEDEELLNENIDEVAQMWWEEYYPSLMENNDEYVDEILDKYNLLYKGDENHRLFDVIDSDRFTIYKNDCQNIMFPELHLEQLNFRYRYSERAMLSEEEALRTQVLFRERVI